MANSFSVTFLGHQGWVLRSDRACLLFDPILCEEFGHAHALDYRVYPPRVLKAEQFPRVDALFLSHEHDDHFDVPSLARIDRRVPVYLSSRSSIAGRSILQEMGFTVHPFVPGATCRFADLEVLALCGDHVNTNTGDEWDTLPYLVRQTEGAGSFFSTVDVKLTQGHIEAVRARAPRPGIVGWTNNAQDWSHVATFLRERTDGTESASLRMRAGATMLQSLWGPPAAMLMCAGGFSFYGPRSWMNHRVFCVDTERVCRMMGDPRRFYSARPGQTFHMKDNRLRSVDAEAPFLTTAPPDTWPSRAPVPMTEFPDYEPATASELPPEAMPELRRRLDEFAGSLVGGTVFKGLYSLLSTETGDRVPSFALVLRDGEQRLVLAYDPSACAFAPAAPDLAERPRDRYLAGMECWAADLLAVLSGDLGPIALAFGRARLWNVLRPRFNFDLLGELFRVSHPLRRPAEVLRAYRRQWQECAGVAPVVLGRDPGA